MGIWYKTYTNLFCLDFRITILHLTSSTAFSVAGNELSGSGIGASVSAELYGKDVIKLKEIIKDLYKNSDSKPSLVAPGGFYNQQWYAKLLQVSGSGIVNIMTHHIYNLGAGELL